VIGFHALVIQENKMIDRLTIIDRAADGKYLCRVHSVPNLHRVIPVEQLQLCLLFPNIEAADAHIDANMQAEQPLDTAPDDDTNGPNKVAGDEPLTKEPKPN